MRRVKRSSPDLRSPRASPSPAIAPVCRLINPTYLAQRERIIEGMRKAGVPEG